jgi:polysaccharide deacetylase family protein (PEP-CTERM system associated)
MYFQRLNLPGVTVVKNALTIDVEDWYHVCGVELPQSVPRSEYRVRAATERILDFLNERGSRATFFMLGIVASSEPELVKRIAADGHEIASHGWSHTLIHQLSPDQFRDELSRTEEIIVTLTGNLPVGFRAPQWSVSDRTPWVHEILAERGYRYDSSLNPLPFIGDCRGLRVPSRISTAAGELREFPPLVTSTWFGNMPTGGGWGFRFFPVGMISRTIAALNRAGAPAVLYLHPRDVDPGGPRLDLPLLKRYASYGGRNDALPRMGSLFKQFEFTTLKELAAG